MIPLKPQFSVSLLPLTGLIVLSAIIAACSDNGSSPSRDLSEQSHAGAQPRELHSEDVCKNASAGAVSVHDRWVRVTRANQNITAAYFTICNKTGRDLTLTSATSPAAKAVEIHQTSQDDQGRMRMRPVTNVPLAQNSHQALSPGGMHIMMIGLSEPILEGNALPMTLMFDGDHAPIEISLPAQTGPVNSTDHQTKHNQTEHHSGS